MNINKPISPTSKSLLTTYHQLSGRRKHLTKNSLVTTLAIGLLILTLTASNSIAASSKHSRQNLSETSQIGQSNAKNGTPEEFARGRILVMPRAGLPAQALTNILKEHNGKARKIGQSEIYIVNVPEYTEENIVAQLTHNPHLKFAELDYQFQSTTTTVNDPYVDYSWHLSKIDAPLAWDISQGSGVTISFLDSGLDSSIPDLVSNIVPGWNFWDNNSNTTDLTGHGTTVVGAAAATINNGIALAGIAGQSKIMPIRITDLNGYGYTSYMAQGLTYAADHGVRVANISYLNVQSSAAVQSAAQYMKNKGGLVTVSGGNTGALENFTETTAMIPVSSTEPDDTKSGFSSYGNYIALSAPGSNIYTTRIGGAIRVSSGTSQASPIVASVIALMMSANPKLSSTQIESLLFSTAVDLGPAGRDPYYGYGRVNAAAAVQAAKNATVTQDTEPPVVSILNPLEGAIVSGLVPVDIDATDNIGSTRAELWVNDTNVATDTTSPFAFTWDSAGAVNGTNSITVRVYDAANNMASATVDVTVDNPVQPPIADTQPPTIQIINPTAGSVSGSITITSNATDDSEASKISQSIYIDGVLKATGTGNTLSLNWNTRSKGVKAGSHTIQATAIDAFGNTSTTSVTVKVVK